MKVPYLVTPRTKPAGIAQAYSQDSMPVGATFAGLGQAVAQFSQVLKEQKNKQEQFEISKRYIEQATARQLDLKERQAVEPLGADGFTKRVNEDYTKQDAEYLAQLRAEGFSDDAINELDLRLSGLRQSAVGESMTFEARSYESKVSKDIDDMSLSSAQLASMNPYDVNAVVDEVNRAIDGIPNLNADRKELLRESKMKMIRDAAGMGLAEIAPDEVVKALSPAVIEGNSKVIADSLRAAGRSDNVVAGFLGNLQHESGFRPQGAVGDNGTAFGIAQWRKERVDNFQKVIGVPITESTIEQQAQFLNWELDNPGAAGMTIKQRDAILAAGSPEEAAELIDQYYERSDGKSRSARKAAARSFVAAPKDGKTGNPVLDGLDPVERNQVLARARTIVNQREVEMRSGLEVITNNAAAAYLTTGKYDGPLPTEAQLVQGYGPIVGMQKAAELKKLKQVGGYIQTMTTSSEAEISSALAAMRPNDTASPTYATDLKAFNEAQQAAAQVRTARKADPAGAVIASFPAIGEKFAAGDPAAAYAAMAEGYEKQGVPAYRRLPMPEQQLADIQAAYQRATPEQRLGIIASWKSQMGELYPNALDQFAKGGMPTEAYLSGLMTESPAHFSTAKAVLRGMDILKTDKSVQPYYTDLNAIFNSTLGEAKMMLSPMQVQAMNEAATALYVASGKPVTRGEIDETAYKAAVKEVLGGRPGTGADGITDDFTILPPNVTEEAFDGWKNGLLDGDLLKLSATNTYPVYSNGTAVSAKEIIDEGKFYKVAPDIYTVFMESDDKPLLQYSTDPMAPPKYYYMKLPASVFGATP